MRLFLGIILGILITVGGAYVSDKSAGAMGLEPQPMVDWDVVGKNVGRVTDKVRQGWSRITG